MKCSETFKEGTKNSNLHVLKHEYCFVTETEKNRCILQTFYPTDVEMP